MNQWDDAEIEARLNASGANGRADLRAIDVHSHYLPEPYRKALTAAGITRPDGYHGGVPAWSAEEHLAHMERLGIDTAIVSISTPGVALGGPTDPRRVAAEANDAGAELVRTHPGRFGFFAALPLPDVDASLAELDRAVSLGAWGVSLLTHTEGVYLGDERLEPVFAELARHRLPVLVHPTAPATLVPGVMEGWSRSMYEFFFDTTRAVTNLVFSGMLARHPGIRLIIPHAGAALPALAQRIERNVWRANSTVPAGESPVFASLVETLRSCYFDLAGSVLPFQIQSLLSLIDDSHIVYGSDFPYTGAATGGELNADLRSTDLLTDRQKSAVLRDNAHVLFPQLTATQGARP